MLPIGYAHHINLVKSSMEFNGSEKVEKQPCKVIGTIVWLLEDIKNFTKY